MFKQQYRLPSGTRLSSQKTSPSETFLLKNAPNDLPHSRFGFVVSKKIDNRAVVRNRTRRVLRSIIESLFNEIQPGFDILFIFKQPIADRTEELETEVARTLRKAELLK